MDTITNLRVENRGGRLSLSLDDLNLIQYTNHYLLYGSEYLAAIAAQLFRQTGENCMAALINTGIPTVFVCDIPISYISDLSIQNLVEKLIRCALEDSNEGVGCMDFTFTFSVTLPSEFITSYYHPKKIGNKKIPRISCPSCKKL